MHFAGAAGGSRRGRAGNENGGKRRRSRPDILPDVRYMFPIMASANSLVRSSSAPSMRRWKS